MGFGTTPTSTTSLGANQFPVSAVASPDQQGGNLIALQGAHGAYQDSNGNQMSAAVLQIARPLIVQSAHNVTGSGGKTLTCQFTNKTLAGNSIVVCVGMGEVEVGGGSPITLAVTDSQGNSFVEDTKSPQSTTLEAAVFHTTKIAGDPTTADTITVTIAGSGSSNTAIGVHIYEVYGFISHTPSALDQTAIGSSAGSTTISTGAIVPSVPNELAFCAIAAAGGTISAGTGWNLDSGSLSPTGGGLVSFGAESTVFSTIVSQTPSASLSASNAWAAACATFKSVVVPIEGTVLAILGNAGTYNTVAPSLSNGQQNPLQLDSHGNLQVNLNTLISGEDQTNNLLVTENRYSQYLITSNSLSAAAKASPGFVHSITIGDPGSAWVINIYNATSATGTPFTIKPTTPVTLFLDDLYSTGIFVTTSGTTAGSASLNYR